MDDITDEAISLMFDDELDDFIEKMEALCERAIRERVIRRIREKGTERL